MFRTHAFAVLGLALVMSGCATRTADSYINASQAQKDEMCQSMGVIHNHVAQLKDEGISPVMATRILDLGIVDADLDDDQAIEMQRWARRAVKRVYAPQNDRLTPSQWQKSATAGCYQGLEAFIQAES